MVTTLPYPTLLSKRCDELIALYAKAGEAQIRAELSAGAGNVPDAMWWADEYHRRWSAYITRKAVLVAAGELK